MNSGQAKAIGIDKLLATLGFQPAEQKPNGELWYKSPWRPNEAEPSFHITPSRLGWKDFGNGERGGNILDFVMLYFKLGNNIGAALRELDRIMGPQPELFTSQRPAPRPNAAQPAPTQAPNAVSRSPRAGDVAGSDPLKITDTKEIAHPALIGYLNTRGITSQLARQYLKEIHFTQHGKNYFALGFPNDQGDYELRNPYYKGISRTKDITSIELAPLGRGSEIVAIFEGFFDYLSALATNTITVQTPAIVLNTTAMKDRALAVLRQHKPAAVHLYLDRDDTGKKLVTYFQEELKGIQVIDQSGLYDGYKDLNEQHQAQQQQRSRQASR